MDMRQALALILDLAAGNMLDPDDCDFDEEDMADEQAMAFEMVSGLHRGFKRE